MSSLLPLALPARFAPQTPRSDQFPNEERADKYADRAKDDGIHVRCLIIPFTRGMIET